MSRVITVAATLAVVLAWLLALSALTLTAAILPVAAIAFAAALVAIFLFSLSLRSDGRRGIPVRVWKRVALFLALPVVAWATLDLVRRPDRQTLTFTSGGTTLVGDLYFPKGGCPCPAAVFVHGSGPGPAWMYAYYARQLAERGVIAFAFDKRGSGRSDGSLTDGGYDLYARNVADAVRALMRRKDVDARRIGLMAYSEGEWVAPMAASHVPIASIVVIGGSGLSPAAQGDEQAKIRMHADGFARADVAEALRLSQRVRHYERTGEGRANLLPLLERAQAKPWFTVAGNLPTRDELADWKDYAWWRSYMDTDPAKIWQVQLPVLVLKGEHDDHSDARLSLSRMSRLIPRAHTVFVREADHILVRYPIRQKFPPAVFADYFDDAANWIRDHKRD